MDTVVPIPFPRLADATAEEDERATRALAEIDAGIALVAGGAAVRVRLGGLPGVEIVAAIGASHAQQAGVGYRLEASSTGPVAVTVGPRLTSGEPLSAAGRAPRRGGRER